MSEPVKVGPSAPASVRRYDNSGREGRSQETRIRVVETARSLFLERGYVTTTIESIAERSVTPVATVYRLFGSKRGILAAVIAGSAIGDDTQVPVFMRNFTREVASEPDPQQLISLGARTAGEILEREAPIQEVLRSAASADGDAAELLSTHAAQRYAGLSSHLAHALAAGGTLRGGFTERDAADVIYTLMSPDAYRLLVVERGWNLDRYVAWLTDSLTRLLVGA